MADPFGDQDQGPGGAKRPAHTIEGTATEVKAEPAASEESRAEPEPKTAESKAETGSDAGTPAPPPRPGRIRSFFTHCVAGLIGGLVGVAALALAWSHLDLGRETSPAPESTALEQRLAKLEAAPAPSAGAEALPELGARVAALEDGVEAISPKLSALADGVAQLQAALKALADTARDGGSVASAAAISQQIAEAEQRLDAKIGAALARGEGANASALDRLENEIGELKAKLGALAEAELGAVEGANLEADLGTLNERLAKLEAALPELAGAIDKEAEGAKSVAGAIAFANLRAAVSDGRPYAAELDTITTLAPALGDLGVLPAFAEKGIPTVPELARSFATAEKTALAAPAPAAGASLVDNLMASAQSLVTIRRIDEPQPGEGPAATLARAKAALDKGDLAVAVKEVETLDAAPREAFTPWLAQAHARLGADQTLARLEGLLLVSMGGDGETAQP